MEVAAPQRVQRRGQDVAVGPLAAREGGQLLVETQLEHLLERGDEVLCLAAREEPACGAPPDAVDGRPGRVETSLLGQVGDPFVRCDQWHSRVE